MLQQFDMKECYKPTTIEEATILSTILEATTTAIKEETMTTTIMEAMTTTIKEATMMITIVEATTTTINKVMMMTIVEARMRTIKEQDQGRKGRHGDIQGLMGESLYVPSPLVTSTLEGHIVGQCLAGFCAHNEVLCQCTKCHAGYVSLCLMYKAIFIV